MSDFFATRSARERRRFSLNRGRAPRGLRATWVEPGQEEHDSNVDLYEYLVGHELFLVEPRGFHICSAHRAARAAVESGRLTPAFRCPFADRACPMRRLLREANGSTIRFTLAEGR